MARGDDSDEERHDRFRSERNTTTLKPLFPGGSKRSNLNSSLGEDRRHERRRSRDRSWRDRSADVRRRDIEDRRSNKRRSYSPDREDQSRKKTREGSRSHSYDKYKNKHRSRGSSEQKSDSHSSHDSRSDIKRSKHSKRNRDEEIGKSAHQVDTFMQRFERRRDSSVEEDEGVGSSVVYRDTSPSPERSKHKKNKNGEREKRKDKKKDKKRKKKSISLERDGSSTRQDGVSVQDLVSAEDRLSPEIGCPKTDVYGPRPPPSKAPAVPSSSPEASLPGNRSSLTESSANQEKEEPYGPVAPPKIKNSSTAESSQVLGVATPEKAPKKDFSRVYGPVLPQREAVVEVDDEESSYGPVLPPKLQQSEPAPTAEDDSGDDGAYGPLPAGLGGRTQEELEMRAALIKRQLQNQEEMDSRPKKREEWMLELPDSKRADLGLGPRKFRAREGPDMSDRSSWTDTPEEKKKKEEMARLGIDLGDNDEDNTNSRRLGVIQRDKEMEKKAREGKKKDKSLLDMHQKELKKKKKKEEKERAGKKEERRPFSREIDLQTNRFDEAQKRSIIKKAQLLDSRFSRGESKFL